MSDELSIYEYYPEPQLDWMLLGWLNRMGSDGELSKTLSLGNGAPSTFLQFFQQRRLFFTVDAFNNLTRACWIEPCMGSIFLSYYIHPDVRADQKEKVGFLFDMISAIFESGVPVVVGFIQERDNRDETDQFIELHKRLGYTYRGSVPHFFDGKDCHIVAITSEDWRTKPNEWKTRWQQWRR